MFEPRGPIQPFINNKELPKCNCGSLEKYEDFLIGEYGAEKVLEVKREEEKSKKMLEEMTFIDKAMLMVPLIASILKKKVMKDEKR